MVEQKSKIRVLAWPARRKRKENPYSFLVQENTRPFGIETSEFSASNLMKFRWDVIHIHWPDMVLLRKGRLFQIAAAGTILTLLFLNRLAGAKLVWTVHNVTPHEQLYPAIGRWYMGCFTKMLDGLLSPSQFGLEAIWEKYPFLRSLPSAVTPIGHYRNEYGALPPKSEARNRYGWGDDEFIMLSFGLVRRYKNLPKLAEELSKMSNSKVRLVIAGPSKDEEETARLEKVAAKDSRVSLHIGYIDQEDVPLFFAAADLMVLPFKNILNSSSALLALSCNKPVLAPAIGAIPELAKAVGGQWVTTYEGDISTQILDETVAAGPTTPEPDLAEFEWDRIGENTADLFRRVLK